MVSRSTIRLAALLAAAMGPMPLADRAAAQACVAVPSDTPTLGAPSSVPFGNNNATDPVFSDTRYQVLVPRALLGSRPLRICDLQVAPAGSRLRRFVELTVTLGHCAAGQLANPMPQNLGAPMQTAGTGSWLLPTTANTWCSTGLAFDFGYDPALGDLVVEFRVRGAGAPTGSGTAGLRTDQALPYMWTTGSGLTGNAFAGGGIKLRLCTDTHGLLELGGGCPGSGGLTPRLSYAGSAQIGGPGLEVRLQDGLVQATGVPVALVWSFGLRPTPLDLGALGAPGCVTQLVGDATTWFTTGTGTQTQPMAVPLGLLPCMAIWNQWFVLDASANALGLAVSNPGRIALGL